MTSVENVVTTPSTSIANEPTNMPLIQYITNIRDKHNPNLDISFMEFFISMYDTDDTLVSAELLADYGVLSIKSGRLSLDGSDIKKLFTTCHLVENIDYQCRQLAALGNRGGKPKDVYTLTPKAFKICLISSKNENRYRDYFLFLEECIHYYNKGQTSALKQENTMLKSTIIEKDDSISQMRLDMQNMIARMDREHEQREAERVIREHEREERNRQHAELLSEHAESKEQMSAMQCTLDKIVKKLDDRAIPPSDSELTERFVLMKKNNIFYVIRSQERRIGKAIKERERLGFVKVADLFESELLLDCAYAQSLPNSIYLWNVIKEQLVKEKKIETKYNKVKLVSITESELLNIIKRVFSSRKELN
jgi:hypothetical protein